MLSAYAPGAPGFVPHTDCSSPSDPRRVTAVYYPALPETENFQNEKANKSGALDGGELVLRPRDADASRRRVVSPRGDRLVAFWSDEVEHEVLGVKRTAREERLALSFWFLKPRPGGARS
jgi:Rps23 Pro-64 3,4-dihydroxylase Tpa1-like proline 4-hydroxylase